MRRTVHVLRDIGRLQVTRSRGFGHLSITRARSASTVPQQHPPTSSRTQIQAQLQHSRPFDHEYDVIVVGSGAGGLTTAVTAALKGNGKVLVTESTGLYGGTSVVSGGAMWLPMNHLSLEQGYKDPRETVEKYLWSYLGSEYDQHEDKISAYLNTVPEMVSFLETNGATKMIPLAAPDYYANLDGAANGGRTVLQAPYDGRRLGSVVKQVRYPLQGYCAFGSMQIDATKQTYWTEPLSSWKSLSYVTRSMLRHAVDLLRYGKGTN